MPNNTNAIKASVVCISLCLKEKTNTKKTKKEEEEVAIVRKMRARFNFAPNYVLFENRKTKTQQNSFSKRDKRTSPNNTERLYGRASPLKYISKHTSITITIAECSSLCQCSKIRFRTLIGNCGIGDE